MSEALNYLVKTRPEAVGHYFAFLKDCGKHLDPKTRDLISVITKVDAQTERGFKQYLGRALRDGCTPMEVLDALLMAFPTLGLAKIVWAVDLILAMDLPGFQPEALLATAPAAHAAAQPKPAAAPVWHDVMAAKDLKDGEITRIECDGRGLFIYRDGRRYQVYDSLCPHQTTNIPHLALAGTTLTCPKHLWVFDVRSGACTSKGDRPLVKWQSKVVKGRLMVRW